MPVTVGIKGVSNGFIVTYNDGESCVNKIYEKKDDDFADDKQERTLSMQCLQSMFYDIMEHFGVFNSKHNDYNLNIELEKNEHD